MPELVRGRLPDRSEPGRPQRSRKDSGPAVKALDLRSRPLCAEPRLRELCITQAMEDMVGRQGSGGRRCGRVGGRRGQHAACCT